MRWYEFTKRRDGMIHALSGGLWLHRHRLYGEPMAHLVSSDKRNLLEWGEAHGLEPRWLQHKPLKDPRTGRRVAAWHWDLLREKLPQREIEPLKGLPQAGDRGIGGSTTQ